MEKDDIRRVMIIKRDAMSIEKKQQASNTIANICLAHQHVKDASVICIYVSLATEVNTRYLLQTMLEMNKCIVVPKVHAQEILLHRIRGINELSSGAFSILEPHTATEQYHPADVDCFIVPGVAFDRSGHRLGWGKGYYDRLLQQGKGCKIGLAFSEQILPLLPHESYDIVMDVVITEKECIETQNKKLKGGS